MGKLRILYLCDRKYVEHKMSRVRFHSVDAIARHPGVEMFRSGPGYDGFVSAGHEQQKYGPHCILWYKPLMIFGYESVSCLKILRYNEMWDTSATTREIMESRSRLVICHHQNDIPQYKEVPGRFVHCPHCAEKRIFKPMNVPKVYDIYITGRRDDGIYPLRTRVGNLVKKVLDQRYVCKVAKHPGYRIPDVDAQVTKYVEEINKARLVITCSSIYQYALAKYIEVGMCGVPLMADIPNERQKWYRGWVNEITPKMSDTEILDKIEDCLQNGDRYQQRAKIGREACLKEMTQENYADRFVSIVRKHLR